MDYCLAFQLAAARTADDLCEQRKGLLKAAEIVVIELLIDRHHANERDIGEIQPLCDHLSAYHYVVFAVCEAVEQLFVRILARGGVGIHPDHPCLREQSGKLALDLLGAEAGIPDRILAALGANA